LMSCSARLPVYMLFIGAFLKDGYPSWLPGLVLFAMYLIGFVTAPLMALLLKKTLLRGETPIFVLELPAYKRPAWRTVFWRMIDAGLSFIRRAGTMILASMIVVWALLYFPHTDAAGLRYEDQIAKLTEAGENPAAKADAAKLYSTWKRDSYLGRMGQTLEPIVRPLGWDWKLGMATLASFPAREVIVGTLGILFNQGPEPPAEAAEGEPDPLANEIRQEWAADPIRGRFAVPVALSVMVFFALCCQCASTLAVIRRETRSWAWPIFTFCYMTGLAYVAAFATFQIGRWIVLQLGSGI
ncbi:MAG: nucleoside recognition domain-containing protein, partial [Gemmataceae bacterium]